MRAGLRFCIFWSQAAGATGKTVPTIKHPPMPLDVLRNDLGEVLRPCHQESSPPDPSHPPPDLLLPNRAKHSPAITPQREASKKDGRAANRALVSANLFLSALMCSRKCQSVSI